MKTTLTWTFSLALHAFALPTIEAHLELTEDDEQPEPEPVEQDTVNNN